MVPVDQAHIDRVPDELLVKILRFAQIRRHPDYVAEGKLDCTRTHSSVLTHVCHRWRAVVLDVLAFWRTLCINLDVKGNHVDRIRAYLERSRARRGLALHITFPQIPLIDWDDLASNDKNDWAPPDLTAAKEVFKVLIEYAHLWRELSIEADCDYHRDWVGQILRDVHVPVLEWFHLAEQLTQLHPDDEAPLYIVESRDIFLGGAPILHGVSYESVTWPLCAVPVAAVTHLSMMDAHHYTTMDPSDLFTLLNATPGLTHLTLFPEDVVDEPEDAIESVVLTSLTHFKASSSHLWLATALYAPSLTSLDLDTGSCVDSFLSFLESAPGHGPFPLLQELKIKAGEWFAFPHHRPLELQVLVDRLPNVEHAAFEVGDHWTRPSRDRPFRGITPVLEAITRGWPKLRTLEASGVDKDALMAFVESRAGTPFHTLLFEGKFVERLMAKHTAIVQELNTLGIQIKPASGEMSDWKGYLGSWGDAPDVVDKDMMFFGFKP